MGNMSHIFDNPNYLNAIPIPLATPEQQLRDAMEAKGIETPAVLSFDGVLHRFSTGGKTNDAGWYVAYGDEVPAGSFGNWRTGETYTFRANIGRPLTFMEQRATDKRIKDAQEAREAEKKARAALAKDSVATIWETTEIAPKDHPYLLKKGVYCTDLHVTGDGRLIVPIYSVEGELVNLQYITATGEKRFHSGADIKGCFNILGDINTDRLFVCEGLATGLSIYGASNTPTVVTFSAGNLAPALANIRQLIPMAKITIVADNDLPNPHTGLNTGLESAKAAATLYGCDVVYPSEVGTDVNDFAQAGGDLAALLNPINSTPYLVPSSDFLKAPSPIRWLVKHWLQADAMVMLFGPSGCGKTFVALDWLLSIATNLPDWQGHRVRGGDVVYLCGEGHHGLRARIAAWSQAHDNTDIGRMFVSQGATDLDKVDGLRLVVQSIHDSGLHPEVIAVDTLNRFLSGDENSAQDTKVFLDSCSALMQEFHCTVLIIHHTGVSAEAQGRARGSSAWKGALDAEISADNKDHVITLTQTKMKDSEIEEPLFCSLESVPIDGWYDEDNEQVTSAIVVKSDAPSETPSAGESKDERCLLDAWREQGTVNAEGECYLTWSGWKEYLVGTGKSLSSAKQALKSNPDRMVGRLLTQGIITAKNSGYIITDGALSSVLLLTCRGVGTVGT
jgi:phage/plasmid primase-like uncharacterized protein